MRQSWRKTAPSVYTFTCAVVGGEAWHEVSAPGALVAADDGLQSCLFSRRGARRGGQRAREMVALARGGREGNGGEAARRGRSRAWSTSEKSMSMYGRESCRQTT